MKHSGAVGPQELGRLVTEAIWGTLLEVAVNEQLSRCREALVVVEERYDKCRIIGREEVERLLEKGGGYIQVPHEECIAEIKEALAKAEYAPLLMTDDEDEDDDEIICLTDKGREVAARLAAERGRDGSGQ